MRSSSSLYIPRIDHLRACALLLVFGWHASHLSPGIPFALVPRLFVLSLFEEGHTGVALFLTLSGFIFASLADGKTVSYRQFLRNRLLRIAPLLILWTLVNFHAQSVIPAERLLSELLILNARGDFPGFGWTVLIELQLYLVFPFLVRFHMRYGPKYLVALVGVLLAIRAQLWVVTHNIQFLSYSTVIGRADQFLLGMLGFDVSRRWGKDLGRPAVLVALVIVWCLVMHGFNRIGGYYYSALNPFGNGLWVYFPTLEGSFYALIIVSYLHLPLRGSKTLGRFFTFVGMVSYSAYLSHYTIAQTVYILASGAGIHVETPAANVVVALLVTLPLVLAFSALTYYVIELPFLNMRHRYVQPSEETGALAPR